MKPQIESFSEFQGCYTIGYAAKGHHDPVVFVEALAHEWGELADPVDVIREYWRNVPQGNEGMISVKAQPGKGAYAVTWIEAEKTRQIVKGAIGGES